MACGSIRRARRCGDVGPDIVPGQSTASPLVRFVAGLEPQMLMPPRGARLTRDEIALIRAWIDQGASWPDTVADPAVLRSQAWWSLRPMARADLPPLGLEDEAWARNPIDRFIRARQRDHRLSDRDERGLPAIVAVGRGSGGGR
jgi:hypothetical protein